jgi:hypothetical protein
VVPNGVGTSAWAVGTGAPATMVSYAVTYASRPASDRNADTLAMGLPRSPSRLVAAQCARMVRAEHRSDGDPARVGSAP